MPALLERLAQRDLLAGRLARVAVAARLQPAVELAVVEQQHARAVGRDRDRAARQVALADPAVEGPLVAPHEGDDPVAVARLLRVGRRELEQRATSAVARVVAVGGSTAPILAAAGRRRRQGGRPSARLPARSWPRHRRLLPAPDPRPALARWSRSRRGRARLRVAVDARVRPDLRRHHAGGGDGAGRLHGRPRRGRRARRAPARQRTRCCAYARLELLDRRLRRS